MSNSPMSDNSFSILLKGTEDLPPPSPTSTAYSPIVSTQPSPLSSLQSLLSRDHSSKMASVQTCFRPRTQASVLRFCLGLENFKDAPPLAYHTVVICFDTEGWTADSSKITEVGFNTFEVKHTRGMQPGRHGENFFKKIYYYHIRVLENCHLLNIKYCPGNPDANRFGLTRFLTAVETKECLNLAFGWPLDGKNQENGVCPVVIMGHALGGDLDKLKLTLGWDPRTLGNVVKVIDTQQLARDVGWWHRRDQVGLQALAQRCNFQYRDAHTASNDAAMTTVAAIKMVLPNAIAFVNDDSSLQGFIDKMEKDSKTFWDWGSDKYCLRCGSRDHMQKEGEKTCRMRVRCMHCTEAAEKDPLRLKASFCHRTETCISYALAHGNSALENRVSKELKEARRLKYVRRRPN